MKRCIIGSVILLLFSTIAYTQKKVSDAKYKMKSLTIATRWAKDVNPKNVLPEYPRPQMVRSNWINLNGLWEYAILKPGAQMPSQFDGKILVPFPIESALSGVGKKLDPPASYNKIPVPQNELWYKRKFNAPELKEREKLLLNFGAVSWEATVYVNGKEAGHHTGSYTAFSIDVTEFIHRGENELTVKVANPLENGIGPRGKQTLSPGTIWYTPSSGIWQTVWLEKVPATYIKNIKITPDVDRSQVYITVNATGSSNVTVATAGKTVSGQSNSQITIPVSNAKLWSPDQPYLYDAEIKMGTDVVKSYFGMRKIEIKKDQEGIDRIYLNNKYTYNLGTLDQGFWPDGLYTAPTDVALKFDIEAIKAMGFNTIRKHIKVEPARWYYHADKLGMLVWQDLVQPASKFGKPPVDEAKNEFEKESAEIIEQLTNYPSITTWVLFNEHWGEYDQGRLTKWVKSTDPTRLVNGHSGSVIVSGKVNEAAMQEIILRSQSSDMTDIHSYPLPAMAIHVKGKANVLGEFGGIGVQVQGHLFDDIAAGWGYGGTVSAGTMCKQYSTMIDSLVVNEKRGLSASIYTQPFDVETEQNGLMTYDRQVIKMPVEIIRKINAKLWPATLNYAVAARNFTAKIADTSKKDYEQLLNEYEAGKKDSATLRALALMAISAKDRETASAVGRAYITLLKNPLSETNVRFISLITNNSKHPG
ncbi:MAG: glycoside hydrolase family 2, partial [Chitinophagaceae bacterium]|nr:glycoside hydrolase family 2 [Chitinophagaceae bacterium]